MARISLLKPPGTWPGRLGSLEPSIVGAFFRASVHPRVSSGTPVRFAPPTRAAVSRDAFLTLGATVGAVGWGVTALLSASPTLVPDPALVSIALWGLLVALMIGVGVLLTPDAVRFSRPMLVWGPANAAASLVTLGVLFGPLPGWTLLAAWALAGAVGYAASARATNGRERRAYAMGAFLELLTLGTVAVGLPVAGTLALLGVCHVGPLLVVTRTVDGRAPAAVVFAWLLVLLVARSVWL